VYLLGVLLHFFIATTVAAIYYAASQPIAFPDRTSAGLRPVLRYGRSPL
jgi:hypothetical protein